MQKKSAIDDLDVESIYIEFMAEAHKTGRWLVHTEDSVDSTQNWVKGRLSVLPDFSAVIASTQTSGRGRMDRGWVSPPGGLYASILLKPSPPPEFAPRVSLLIALILCELLEDAGLVPWVKWPNDVVVNERKVAGIIAECGNSPCSWFILGVGVNLSAVPDVPGRDHLPAGAWCSSRPAPSPHELLVEVLSALDIYWSNRESDPLSGRAEAISGKLWNKGKKVKLSVGDETFSGIVTGISGAGSLILSTDSGERRFVSGELLTVHGESMRK